MQINGWSPRVSALPTDRDYVASFCGVGGAVSGARRGCPRSTACGAWPSPASCCSTAASAGRAADSSASASSSPSPASSSPRCCCSRARVGRPHRLGHFWSRRARRILPAALLALAGIALYGLTVADAHQAARLPGDGLSALGRGRQLAVRARRPVVRRAVLRPVAGAALLVARDRGAVLPGLPADRRGDARADARDPTRCRHRGRGARRRLGRARRGALLARPRPVARLLRHRHACGRAARRRAARDRARRPAPARRAVASAIAVAAAGAVALVAARARVGRRSSRATASCTAAGWRCTPCSSPR